MSFFRDASIKGGVADLFGYMREQRGSKLMILLLACVPTATIITMFYFDAMGKATPPPPTVTYIESWPADRSVEESLAAIREHQKTKDAMRARERVVGRFGRAAGRRRSGTAPATSPTSRW